MERWVEVSNVAVVGETDDALICRVGERDITILRHLIRGGEVWEAGDRGRLVIPYWVAADLRLI
jgi:hypothetical protein